MDQGGLLSVGPGGGLSSAPGGGLYNGPGENHFHGNIPPLPIFIRELEKRGLITYADILRRNF